MSSAKAVLEKCGNALRRIARSIRREQILCIAAAVLLAGLSWRIGQGETGLLDGSKLLRGNYGSVEKEYTLRVEGLEGEEPQIMVRVAPREYSEEEAEAAFAALMEELPLMILGDNENLSHVDRNLSFPGSSGRYPGIRLRIYPNDPEWISSDGELHTQEGQAPVETSLTVQLRAGSHKAEYIVPLTVFPALAQEKSPAEELEERIKNEEARDRTQTQLVLPGEYRGRKLSYSMKQDGTWWKLLLAGMLAAMLLGLKPAQDERKALKKRENELLMDYSEMVSKLIVYTGAGLTVRNAWIRITEEYQRQKEGGDTEPRAVYEEMHAASLELKKGISERKVYMDFAHRCGLKCYLKLASVLEQNRRTGDGRMETALLLEMQEAFEQRKNTARRLGEEAGTKLMGPLILSLVTVMMIVVIPAMLTLA